MPVKRARAVGLFCGWVGWQAVVTATLLGFAAASVSVLVHRVAKPSRQRMLVPMVPFMATGALAAILLAR